MSVNSAKQKMEMKLSLFYRTFFVLFLLVVTISGALAQETSNSNPYSPVQYVVYSSIWLVLISVGSIIFKDKIKDNNKKYIFWIMVLPVVLSALYLSGYTIYENITSETNGPVHWHADYQVLTCGNKLDLVNPTFPKNKIGSPLLHEHNDDRIHIEGTVNNLEDISLGKYFEVIGGKLEEGHLIYNTVQGIKEYKDGDECNGTPSSLKVYVNGERIEDYADYLYYPDPLVPPGDCIIISFDPSESETIDILCESWEVKGWNYENYKDKRDDIKIGDRQWQ